MANFIVYHQRDLDGKCSGAIAFKALRERGEGATLIPIDYGWKIPEVLRTVTTEDNVYIVDFSLECDNDMFVLNNRTNLFWVDHHDRRIEELESVGFLARGQITAPGTPAAVTLTWELFYPEEDVPKAVELVSVYDTWQCHPEWDTAVLPFQIGMQLYENHPGVSIWHWMLENNEGAEEMTQDVIDKGRIAIQYRTTLRNRLYKDTVPLVWTVNHNAYECLAINAEVRGDFWDELDQRGFINKSDYDLLIGYHYDGKPGWRVSLEPGNSDEVDASAVAKQFGGGGHPGRAGFVCEFPVFLTNRQ